MRKGLPNPLGIVFCLLVQLSVETALAGAPKSTPHEVRLEKHGHVRVDPYYWYREKENPLVRRHLEAENDFVDQTLSSKIQSKLLKEIKARVPASETSLSHRNGTFEYFYRYPKGQDHPIYFRQKLGSKKNPQKLLDVNQIAKVTGFAECPEPVVSPNGRFMAYACDLSGQRTYTVRIKNIATQVELPTVIENADSNVLWAKDNQTLYYTVQDEQTLRSDRVYRLNVFDEAAPELVYQEPDTSFNLALSESVNQDFIFIECGSTDTKSVLYVSSSKPKDPVREFQPRIKGLEYEVFDGGHEFFIRTNWQAENFRVMKAPLGQTSLENWQEFSSLGPEIYISEILVLDDFVVADVYANGLNLLQALSRRSPIPSFEIRPDDPLATLGLLHRKARTVQFWQESLTQPQRLVTYSLAQKKVLSQKSKSNLGISLKRYETRREWATARDGVRVPLTVLKSKSLKFDGTAPALIIGYGAYGSIDEFKFRQEIFSLLDRGFVVVHAHVRGGGQLGRSWYDLGRKQNKLNTFLDFIDSTEYLIGAKMVDRKRIFAQGMSAGGLLMGVIANLRPDLYRGLIAEVPFVDVVTTMLDDTLPLTTGEYNEWGNPNVEVDYRTILAYSPYDNIKAQAYPHIFALAGWNDGQVPYWEPMKWISKLRDYNTADSTILLRTHMNSGHEGPAGRYGPLADQAAFMTFLLQNSEPLSH